MTQNSRPPLGVAAGIRQTFLFLVIGCSLLTSDHLKAAEIPHVFLRLGTGSDPFPNEHITYIYKGSYGFMWFGHARGLLRYDGSTTRWYRHQPQDDTSLPAGGVRCIFEDQSGSFWVGTNGGLARLNRRTGKFKRIPLTKQDLPLTANNIWALEEDSTGNLWVGTAAGLFTLKAGELHPFPVNQNSQPNGVTALLLDTQQKLWVATESAGLFIKDMAAEGLQAVPGSARPKLSTLLQAKDGTIWVGSLGQGIALFSEQGEPMGHIQTEGSSGLTLASDVVQALQLDDQGHIWIGTQNGLHYFDWQQNHITRIPAVSGRPDRLRGDNIKTLYAGEPSLVWVATSIAGVDLLNLNQRHIRNLPLAGKSCLALAQTSAHEIFIGTRSGLASFDPSSQKATWHLQDQTVRSICPTSGSQLWVGTDAGLFLVLPKQSPNRDKHMAFHARIWDILADGRGHLWAASDTGLLKYEPDSGQETHFPVDANSTDALNYQVATSLALEDDAFLWIGTFGGGLNRLQLATNHFEHFPGGKDDPHGLKASDIVDLHLDRSQRLWIATLSGGLHYRDPKTNRFTAVPLPSQHHDQTPIAITSDPTGFIWLSTGAGLLRFDPSTETFFRIRPIDGLDMGSVLPGSIHYDEGDRRITVGGVEGMAFFHPKDLPERDPTPLVFSGFKAGQDDLRHLLLPGETLELPRQYKSFSLTFAMLDYLSHLEQEFAFQRQNIDRDWIVSKGIGEANYTHLGGFGGDYTLKVKASSGNGIWQSATFTTQIQPPRWLAWLPLFVFLGLSLLITLIYRLVSLKERKKRAALEEKARLADQRRVLAETQTEVAEKARDLEREKRHFQEEHAQIVQNYLERRATEIANNLHDGPLGSLHGLGFTLHELSEQAPEGDLRQCLEQITTTRLPEIRDHLRHVCGDLLLPDFSNGLIPAMENLLASTAAKDPTLRIERHFHHHESLVGSTQGVVFRIFRIFLANLEKHAHATKATITLEEDQGRIHLKFQDNGRGFQVPTDWNLLKSQNHYGLYMVAYFAEMLGGHFQAKSKPEHGSTFHVSLPAQNSPEGYSWNP